MKKIIMALIMCIASSPIFAATVKDLQHEWAIANYQLEGEAQKEKFEALIEISDTSLLSNTSNPDLLIWNGIIKSTFAGKAGGLSALSLIKSARASLEKAMEVDDMALQGSAYTSLGALYYQVPGWPISFGNDKKARQLLERAVSIDPTGIDSNYFYGDFLVKNKEYQAAKEALKKALAAPARPERAVADKGRRAEIQSLLDGL